MFEAIRTRALRVLRVPHDPEPPTGAPGSVRVFRAGVNFYKLRLARWGLAQIGALAGIIFSLVFLGKMERGVDETRAQVRQQAAAASVTLASPAPIAPTAIPQAATPTEASSEPPKAEASKTKAKSRPSSKERTRSGLRRIVERWPAWLFPVLRFLEWAGIALYVAQIPITYALVRLDYELRWYIVTDRSLRIRAGLTTVQESTMSFANVQQVGVSQGPVQRLLGIADLRVQSAGGGGDHHEAGAGDSLHTGVFHGVDNASEIRDLILERLRLFRQAGLGDPDDPHLGHPQPAAPAPEMQRATPAIAAARELLQEARALRNALH